MKTERQSMAHIFGGQNLWETCPWRAYEDPLTLEVAEVYGDLGGYGEHGPDLATYLLSDPPHLLWEGLRFFRAQMSRMRAQKLHEREQKSKRQR